MQSNDSALAGQPKSLQAWKGASPTPLRPGRHKEMTRALRSSEVNASGEYNTQVQGPWLDRELTHGMVSTHKRVKLVSPLITCS
eukprot:3811041-Amphidinium_carterae.4